jgi:hypothetical protein
MKTWNNVLGSDGQKCGVTLDNSLGLHGQTMWGDMDTRALRGAGIPAQACRACYGYPRIAARHICRCGAGTGMDKRACGYPHQISCGCGAVMGNQMTSAGIMRVPYLSDYGTHFLGSQKQIFFLVEKCENISFCYFYLIKNFVQAGCILSIARYILMSNWYAFSTIPHLILSKNAC